MSSALSQEKVVELLKVAFPSEPIHFEKEEADYWGYVERGVQHFSGHLWTDCWQDTLAVRPFGELLQFFQRKENKLKILPALLAAFLHPDADVLGDFVVGYLVDEENLRGLTCVQLFCCWAVLVLDACEYNDDTYRDDAISRITSAINDRRC